MLKFPLITAIACLACQCSLAADEAFRGIVSSASPEATAAGVAILESGGNAIDAAVAVSLTLGVTEPAGSGIAGQTVILLKRPGEAAQVIQGTTWSPREIPAEVSREQLRYGHTASSVPSTLRVLDVAHRKFGGGKLGWPALVQPAIDAAEQGFAVGPFRQRAFRNYRQQLQKQAAAAGIFIKSDGSDYQVGDTFRQPLLAKTLQRIASKGAMDFYNGAMADEIVADVSAHGGWISHDDLALFPEPRVVPALRSSYRGYAVETLPPPFGGWVVLHILGTLETLPEASLASDNSQRRLALLDALRDGHAARAATPHGPSAGETTHFSVVDGDGMAVSVTQSIDSYFGAQVAHPTLGFLYNNYMQGFQVNDPDAAHYLRELQMPMSSMSASIVSQHEQPQLVLGSPGSARIISAVAQVISHWVDIGSGVVAAVAAYRVHVVADDRAYVEGPELPAELLGGMAERGFSLHRPAFGVSDSQLDAYFGGVNALAFEDEAWTGAADPRRDGTTEAATK